MIYLSTFTTGTEKYIKLRLKKFHTSIRVITTLDGLIVYSCDLESSKIAQIRFFTNSFIVISEYEKSNIFGFGALIQKELQSNNIDKFTSSYFRAPAKFRIVFMDKNIPASVSNDLRQSLEKKIAENNKLSVNRVIPDCEFWFMKRSEHVAFFLLKLTYHQTAEKLYRKGELHREVSQILNIIAEPKKTDVLCDPFCGYASIGLERSYLGKCEKIICIDTDESKIAEVKHRVSRCLHPSYFEIRNEDFFASNIKSESIDKIVTDPPWGDFTAIENIDIFFNRMLSKFQNILKKDGVLVLLTSKKMEFENSIKGFDCFVVADKLNILVSGKKAAIFKVTKK